MRVVCIKKTLFFIMVIFGFLMSSVYAVSDIQITPSNPKVGDTITITGTANPNEAINCQAWFEVNPAISEPYYGYLMYNVDIPTTPNTFKVVGENVNDLTVNVKIGTWIPKGATANSDGVAVVSQSNVPVGTYDIKIIGKIKDSSKPVKLKIIASTTIKADENGNFEYSYKANNIPEGTTIHLNIGGISRDVLIEADIPTPPPTVTDNTTIANDVLDKEPPKITILSPTKREFKSSEVTFDIVVEDQSSYSVDIYLNGNKINYDKINNHYTGNLILKEGENTLKIIAEDNCSNKNEKIIYLTYKLENISEELENSAVTTTTNTATNNNENPVNDVVGNNNPNDNSKENIVEGTIIKHIGENAMLIIQHGTKITKEGEIQIKEIPLPNTTLAYYIAPKDAEFSIPLTLKINMGAPENKELKILYYDDKSKSWKNIPYTIDEENNIVLKVSRSGYYAIKETNTSENKDNNSIFSEITMIVKIVIGAIITLIKSKLNLI